MDDFAQESHKKIVTLIAFEDLRRRLIDSVPEVQAQINQMASLIRELVKLEREKRGFDNPRGTIMLYPNKEKKDSAEPAWTGSGYAAGRLYRAMAWFEGDKLKVALLPQKRK